MTACCSNPVINGLNCREAILFNAVPRRCVGWDDNSCNSGKCRKASNLKYYCCKVESLWMSLAIYCTNCLLLPIRHSSFVIISQIVNMTVKFPLVFDAVRCGGVYMCISGCELVLSPEPNNHLAQFAQRNPYHKVILLDFVAAQYILNKQLILESVREFLSSICCTIYWCERKTNLDVGSSGLHRIAIANSSLLRILGNLQLRTALWSFCFSEYLCAHLCPPIIRFANFTSSITKVITMKFRAQSVDTPQRSRKYQFLTSLINLKA